MKNDPQSVAMRDPLSRPPQEKSMIFQDKTKAKDFES